jgi:hypothetical protein
MIIGDLDASNISKENKVKHNMYCSCRYIANVDKLVLVVGKLILFPKFHDRTFFEERHVDKS